MECSFDVDVARKFGIDAAVAIKTFEALITMRKDEAHRYEGRYWVRVTLKELSGYFPFWTESKTRNVIRNLIKKGVLLKANYNIMPDDNTLWYAFKNENNY